MLKEDKEQLRKEIEEQTLHWQQIEEENIKARKENLTLQNIVEKLKKERSQQATKMEELQDDNISLQARYDTLKTRVEMMKEIDKSLNQDELENMKNTNLQVADTLSKLTQRLSTLSEKATEGGS